MKRTFTLLLCLLGISAFAQNYIDDTAEIAKAEMKSSMPPPPPNGMSGNTGNYDITYQKLEFEADPAVLFISGTITTDYTATEEMSTITFDLHNNLTVSSVVQDGDPLVFEQTDNHELVITLGSPQAVGTEATISVMYSGVPPLDNEAFMIEEHAGEPVLWTLSQPYGSRDWWPCKHDLNDKVDHMDIYITAPSQYVSVANGVEQSQEDNGDGTKTTHFQHNYPIPAYLIAFTISNYTIYNQEAGNPAFPVVNYLYPEDADFIQGQLAVLPEIVDLFEELFEPYPFNDEKYGHAQCGFGGGMEHTTVSFMGSFGRNIVAHELAHQWFGNKVTCGSWSDLWLNEGFATYLSGLVVEHLDGEESFTGWKQYETGVITEFPDGSVYVPAIDTLDQGRLFSSRLTYHKGAMVAHMLRYKIGDTAFYQGLRNYLDDTMLAYAYAKTPQLQAHLEETSGMDLTEFFNDWVYGEGYPTYDVTAHNVHEGVAKITISQSQSHPSVSFYEMPCMVRLFGPEGQWQDYTLENTVNNQEFLVGVPFIVTNINFEPGRNIISADNTATLATADFDRLSGITVYPNPSSSILNITLPDGMALENAVFYNTLGQKVMESRNANCNVSGLAEGTYFVTLNTSEGTRQVRFVKAS